MAFAKLSAALRRNELFVLASLLAGLVMALFEMAVTWTTGSGIWAFPGYVSATVFRDLQAGGVLTFGVSQIATGMAIHLGVAVALGGLFAWLAPRLREALGLDSIAETPAYGLLGLGFGLGAFATAWWGLLPYANPIMVQGMDPTFLAIAHGIWGMCLGVTRKAWTQQAPQLARHRAASAPQPTPATPSHKAPSGSSGAYPTTEETETASDVETLRPEEAPEDDEEDDPQDDGGEPEPASASSEEDELSPWPEPPDPPPEDEEAQRANGHTSASSSSSTPSSPEEDEEEEEDEGLAMTEHARRSLRGLTDRDPDLPPIHKALKTTLTHVAPGRAVCTIDADERLHDATGAVQSGLLISLGELAATIAMETVAPEAEHATVASEVQVEGFVEEGHVVAEAEVTEVAGTTTLAEAEVRDATGKVLVKASFQAVTADDEDR